MFYKYSTILVFSINALFSTLDDVVIEGTTDIFQLPKTYCKLFINLFLKNSIYLCMAMLSLHVFLAGFL